MYSQYIAESSQEAAIRSFLDLLNRNPEDCLGVEKQIEVIGQYFGADRSYVFEQDESGAFVDNTFEWCREGITPEKENLQHVPVEVVEIWKQNFRKDGAFLLTVNEELKRTDPLAYETLEPQSIDRLMAAPFSRGGELVGFFGVDNPTRHTDQLLLISVMAASLFKEISYIREEEKHIAQVREIEKLNEALAESIATIDGLNQEYHTIGIVDKSNMTVRFVRSSEHDTVRKIKEMGYRNLKLNEVVDMYIEHYVDPRDKERLGQELANEMILGQLDISDSYTVNYLRKNDCGELRFHQMVCANVKSNGSKRQFVFGARDIDRIVKEEQAIKQQLQSARDEAEQAKETIARQLRVVKSQHSSMMLSNEIISAIAKMYFAMFRIDLENDFYEEISSVNEVHSLTGHEGSASSKMVELCNSFVSEDFHDDVMEFFDLSTLADRLENQDMVDMNYLAKDGKWHVAGFISKKRNESGKTTNVLYVSRLVSVQKVQQIEQTFSLRKEKLAAERASNAKTAFLFNMSHDIRTPMNAIIGYADLMERYFNDTERCRGYLKKIRNASDFLLSLINNVLEMARIESGKVVLDEVICDANEIAKEVSDVYSGIMADKGIDFTLITDIRHPYHLCDKVKINEVFLNLVSNAYKYTPSGGKVSLTVREIPSDKPGMVTMESTISDTGIGMSKEYLPRLFEEFSREHTSTENKVEGTGLGMPIVKRLVDLMGGTITVESELGKGTTFVVRIPHRIAENVIPRRDSIVNVDSGNLVGKRILLAEDNELNTEIVMEILSEAGFVIDHAKDGIVCVDMLSKSPDGYYDLILMDIQMPNMDGYKATTVIRRMERDYCRNIPIIAMTANAFEEDRRNALQAGMNGHLSKPIDIEKLMETLAQNM